MSIKIDPKRVIEVTHFGRFYIVGTPKFVVAQAPDFIDNTRSGFIIIAEDAPVQGIDNIHQLNCLFKMTKDGRLIHALFKAEYMAQEVCKVCNGLKL